MSESLFHKGLAVLRSVAGDLAADLLDFEKTDQRLQLAASATNESVEQWHQTSGNYLTLIDWIPRDLDVSQGYRSTATPFFDDDICSFINDVETDPHLLIDLAGLHDAIVDSGYDPSHNLTTTEQHLPMLILFGTGDGVQVKRIIDQYDPILLVVVVTEWEDWASSFSSIDWLDIWNARCNNPSRRIGAFRVDDARSLQAYLINEYLPLLEHAALYLSPSAPTKLKSIYDEIKGETIRRQVRYLGFVMDEYNMIWNSWYSLLNKPRIFSRPIQDALNFNAPAIVCGSGPSLDLSLEIIRELSQSHLIIACASNYGTLRKAGIEVDILCLLERGDFMIDQYRQVVQDYGAGCTRLLASATTPVELQSLFNEPMIYFRPALTPVAVFADNPAQVLVNEGPQTINTGVAFASQIGCSRIVLFGVDLGVVSLNSVRSADAIGDSPREFNEEHPGNLVDTVFTTMALLDGKVVLEATAPSYIDANIELFNASNGVLIKGFDSIQPLVYLKRFASTQDSEQHFQRAREQLFRWWHQQPCYQPDRFMAMWRASKPRERTHDLINELINCLRADEPWIPQTAIKIAKILKCDNIQRSAQFGRRIIRGHILKLVLSVTRQRIIMVGSPEQRDTFEIKARQLIINRLETLEREIFSLLDCLEATTIPNSVV